MTSVLLIKCPDQPGIIAAVSGWIHTRGGNILDADQHTDAATTVRVRNGKLSATDGPFAETKEQLGGYFLIEAKDLNDAIQVASRIPSAKWGSIEVRPVWG